MTASLTRREALIAGVGATLATCAAALGASGCSSKPTSNEGLQGFTPQLDTQTKVDIDITGPFGNFEALDQVENDFNKIYPNVTFYYEQVGGDLGTEIKADVFATTEENLFFPHDAEKYAALCCTDLTATGLDTSAVEQPYLDAYTIDGKLLSLPVSLKIDGIVVNETLLDREGLGVPENLSEFMTSLETLKSRRYAPIQGPVDTVYENLISNMVGYLIGTDPDLQAALQSGNLEAACAKLAPAFERLAGIVEGGYTDYAVNETYPYDNYDGAILAFFEGDVPFWVCDTEKFSGMKKRESKSEAFSAEPFEYRFIGAPMADDGTYIMRRVWYGFSVNKNSAAFDYAVEFLRFLATQPELEKIACVKGVPCVTVDASDERFTSISDTEPLNKTYASDGTVNSAVLNALQNAVRSYVTGGASIENSLETFVGWCAELFAQ